MNPTTKFRILVGNVAKIPCLSICHKVLIQLQSNSFEVDLYVMPLSGANVVLGAQWLKTLGLVLTDYEALTMKFIWDGKLITLNTESGQAAKEISLHQLRRVTTSQRATAFFHLRVIPPPNPRNFPLKNTLP